MLIIGERINSTRKSIGRAVSERDSDFLRQEARLQVQAGAQMLDVNCGTLGASEEPEVLKWLVQLVQEAAGVPLCVDSPNPAALAAGLSVHQGKALVNSISGETERYNSVLPLVKEHGAGVVALGIDDNGIPRTTEQSLEVGRRLVGRLLEAGVPVKDIYFDPLVRTIATDGQAVLSTLQVMETMVAEFKGLHIVSGLSNVSYGLPERRHLNRAYLVLSIEHGLDTVIIDPTDATARALVLATEAVMNRDRHCLRYIKAYQQGVLAAK